MTQPWMTEAWGMVGQSEVGGPEANPAILDMFRDAGHADITSDETAWCAAFVSACLFRAGMPYPKGVAALRARDFESWGTACDLRPGAIVVIRARGDQRHVFFCSGADARNVIGLGGNQANSVNNTPFPLASIVAVRWPAPAATAADLKGKSRTIDAAAANKGDAAKASGAELSRHAADALPDPVAMTGQISGKARETMGAVDTLVDFAGFLKGKWPWLAGALALYFLARMAWRSGLIERFRLEDHNTGKTSLVGAGVLVGATDTPTASRPAAPAAALDGEIVDG